MPTWLVHGFRWPRPLIRIHIILQNLDDAAEGWLIAPLTTAALIENFHELYTEQMQLLPSLRFAEQYNPDDLVSTEQPYAYVCDQSHEVGLSVDIDEVRGKGVANEAWAALADLRDKIAPGEKIGWFVVVNGDPERWAPPAEGADAGTASTDRSQISQISPNSQRSSVVRTESADTDSDHTQREPKGLRKWFSGKARRARSSKDMREILPVSTPPHNALRNVVSSAPKQNATAPLPSNGNGKAPAQVKTSA